MTFPFASMLVAPRALLIEWFMIGSGGGGGGVVGGSTGAAGGGGAGEPKSGTAALPTGSVIHWDPGLVGSSTPDGTPIPGTAATFGSLAACASGGYGGAPTDDGGPGGAAAGGGGGDGGGGFGAGAGGTGAHVGGAGGLGSAGAGGGAGADASGSTPGAGVVSSINGTPTEYGRGGGPTGAAGIPSTPGGGGQGANISGVPSGDINTGFDGFPARLVVRYVGPQSATGGTITTDGTHTIHTFGATADDFTVN
jgi:hypothetical protein